MLVSILGLTSPRLHYGHSFASTCADIGTSRFGTGAEMERGPIWVFRYETQFWNWASSFETGRPVSKLGEWQNNFEPSSGTGSSSSRTGCPELARCRFGNVDVPVPELDDQCRNLIGAEMGSNILELRETNLYVFGRSCLLLICEM